MSCIRLAFGLAFALGLQTAASAADMVTKAPATAPAQIPPWTVSFDTETRYSSWERTKGNLPGVPNQKGSQSYTPVSAQAVGMLGQAVKLEFLMRGGYVSTTRSAQPFGPFLGVPFSTGSVATTTDTILSGTATYLAWDGIQPFYSLNLNMPTGKTVLLGRTGIARTDPDLVDIPTFGEGFNNGHTLGVNIPFTTDMMLTLSGSYTKKGDFEREIADPQTLLGVMLPLDQVEPGDVKAASANFAAAFGQLSINLSASETFFDSDAVNRVETFRNGRSLYLAGAAAYKWDAMWSSTLSVSHTQSKRLLVANPVTGQLLSEPANSNSNLLRASFMHALAWNSFIFNVNVGYLHRDQNDYDPFAQAFVPAKTKWSAGGGARYAATGNLTLSAKAERFWIDEDVKPDFSGLGAVNGLPMSYEGWLVSAGATLTF